MRILALTNLYPNPWQPDRAPFNLQQFRALATQHSLRVISPVAWTDELSARWKGSDWSAVSRQTNYDGITVDYPRYMFTPKICRSLYGQFYRQSVRRSFNRALSEFRPDIVFATWAYPDGWAAVKLGHEAGLPVVVKVHGSDIYQLDEYPGRKRRTREALCAADRVIAVSKDLANRVIELGVDSKKVHVIYNGVDTNLFYPSSQMDARIRLGLPTGQPMVLFVGNLVPIKGVDVLIDACAGLVVNDTRFAGYLIGDGPLQPQLEQQIWARGLKRSMRCLGSKPHAELPDWYRAADVVVLPSYSEGLPNVLLEAAACGTRFVASDVGGIREIAADGRGKLVPPGDVAALAKAIHDQMKDSKAGSVGSVNPPRSFAESAVELANLFERTIESHHAPAEDDSELCPTR